MSYAQSNARATSHVSSALLVGKADLQEKILANIVGSKFGLNVRNVRLDPEFKLEMGSREQLLIINCESLSCDSVIKALKNCSEEIGATKNVLVNVDLACAEELKSVWHMLAGIFYENIEPDMFLTGMEYVLNGGLWLPRHVMECLLLGSARESEDTPGAKRPGGPKLTRRELQILEKISEGCSNETIAEKLFLSKHTVKTHLYNIYKKVNVKNRTEAANWLKRYVVGKA